MKLRQFGGGIFSLFGGLFIAGGTAQAADKFTGRFLTTGNLSTQMRLMPSLNGRLTANYAPGWATGNFDFRLERYTENSYHSYNGNMDRER